MAMQADTTDNNSRMRVNMAVFQGRQSYVPCNKYVSVELLCSACVFVWGGGRSLQTGQLERGGVA